MYKKVNPNPLNKAVGDCTVRALCIAENIEWKTAYMELCTEGFRSADMPSSNEVMERLLLGMGYKKEIIKTNCNDCFTIKDFCKSNPEGGAVTPIAVDISVNGESRPTSRAIFTPAAVDEYGNVTSTAIITVPKGCCFSMSVRYVDATVDDATTTPTPTIEVQNANLVINRVA